MSCFLPRADLVGIEADADIGGNDNPFLFCSEGLHPYHILLVCREFVFEVKNPVLRFNHLVEAVGKFWNEVVVEEEFHAASCCSNSSASRTEPGLISNQRATSAGDPLARTLRART